MFEFEYFWAILLLFIMDRICCLQDQYEKDLVILPDPQHSSESLASHIDNFADKDKSLKMSFIRLCRLGHIVILFSLVYFCNISLWFFRSRNNLPRSLRFRLKMIVPVGQEYT